MNIDQARRIPIATILDKMGKAPQRTKGDLLLYFSPLKNNREPSLWVNPKTNRWFDLHDRVWKGGDGIHLVRAYLFNQKENFLEPDALRWLSNMTDYIPRIRPVKTDEPLHDPKRFRFRDLRTIENEGLIKFGNRKGIQTGILRSYFKQLKVAGQNDEVITGLAMQNESKGYEMVNPFISATVGKRNIIFIRGTKPKPPGIHVFMRPFDFASVITQRRGLPLSEDAMILTSLNMLDMGSAYIRNYGYASCYTWMDNSRLGIEATSSWRDFCKTENGLIHVPMNEGYLPHSNVNAAHIAGHHVA